MIRVTVELFPNGDETRRRVLTEFDIANDGTGTEMRGNYKVRKTPKDKWLENAVQEYPRQAYNVRWLVFYALEALKKAGQL